MSVNLPSLKKELGYKENITLVDESGENIVVM